MAGFFMQFKISNLRNCPPNTNANYGYRLACEKKKINHLEIKPIL